MRKTRDWGVSATGKWPDPHYALDDNAFELYADLPKKYLSEPDVSMELWMGPGKARILGLSPWYATKQVPRR